MCVAVFACSTCVVGLLFYSVCSLFVCYLFLVWCGLCVCFFICRVVVVYLLYLFHPSCVWLYLLWLFKFVCLLLVRSLLYVV